LLASGRAAGGLPGEDVDGPLEVPDYYPALTPRQHRHQRLVEPRGLPVEIGFATLPDAGTAASHKPSADESLFCDFCPIGLHGCSRCLMAECNGSDRMIKCFDGRRLRFCPDAASLMLLLQRHTMVTTLANRRLTVAATMEVRSDQRVVVGLRLVYVDSPSVVRDFIHESNARGRHSEPVLRQDEIRKRCVEKAVH
jgi:hypothetical protein